MRSQSTSTPTYLAESFLVRRWRVSQDDWRYALQRIPDGAWQGFASAADMLAYLNRVNSVPSDGEQAGDGSNSANANR